MPGKTTLIPISEPWPLAEAHFKKPPAICSRQRLTYGPPPAGFRYASDPLSAAGEQEFVAAFRTLPFKPFEFHGHQGNRSYGYRYYYAGRALRASDAMPDFLLPLREVASQFSGITVDKLEQALVTKYAPGAGIGWRQDKPMFEDVVALSLLAPCALRLRRQDGNGWQRQSSDIAPRSGYLLRGAVRSEWEHSIVPMDVLRYSVTFRSF